MVRLITIAGAMLALTAPIEAQQSNGTPALDRAIAAYKSVKTVRATFTQHLKNPVLGTTATASGTAVQQRPGRIAITFTDPKGDRIVADGAWLWLYLPSTAPGQVIKTKVGANAAGIPDVTASFLEAPRSKYAAREGAVDMVGGRKARALHLTAKDATLPFTKATVWVDERDGLIRQFETTEPSGLVRRITITKLEPNAAVKAGEFRFTPPSGVRVVVQ